MAGGPGDDDCSRQQDSLVLPLVERQVVLDEHPGDVVREVVRSPFTDIPARHRRLAPPAARRTPALRLIEPTDLLVELFDAVMTRSDGVLHEHRRRRLRH